MTLSILYLHPSNHGYLQHLTRTKSSTHAWKIFFLSNTSASNFQYQKRHVSFLPGHQPPIILHLQVPMELGSFPNPQACIYDDSHLYRRGTRNFFQRPTDSVKKKSSEFFEFIHGGEIRISPIPRAHKTTCMHLTSLDA